MFKKLFNKIFSKSNTEKISFRQGFDLTNVPIVTFYQGDKKFNFLLDTGSTHNVIDSNILDVIEHSPMDTCINSYGIEGNKTSHEMCEISLYYKDQEYHCECIISDMGKAFGEVKKESGVTLHGLIGSIFFNKYKYVLDFDELIAYSKG